MKNLIIIGSDVYARREKYRIWNIKFYKKLFIFI